LFDHFGNYVSAFELNILTSAVGILALAFATMPRHGSELVAPVEELAVR
jgi:hypothetical protein